MKKQLKIAERNAVDLETEIANRDKEIWIIADEN
mgnify:CR=1 FL=1